MFLEMISFGVLPGKSIILVRRLKSMDPRLKTSDLKLAGLPFKISGATKPGVPHFIDRFA